MKYKILLLILVLSMILSILPMSAFAQTENQLMADETGKDINGKNWMSQLPDDAPLGQINLPGSSDSLFKEFQDKTIEQQLEMGVRLFTVDAIPKSTAPWENWDIQNSRGLILDYQIRDLFILIDEFLIANSTETVVVLFTPSSFYSAELKSGMLNGLKSIAEQNERTWWRFTYFENGDTIPTVGQMRGRCVLLNVRDDSATPFRVSGYDNIISYVAYDIRWFIHMALEAQYNHIPQDYTRTKDTFCNELNTSNLISPSDYPFEYTGEPNIKLVALNCIDTDNTKTPIEVMAKETVLPELKNVTIYKGQRLGWVLLPFVNEDFCKMIMDTNLFHDQTAESPFLTWPKSIQQPDENWETQNWMSRLPDDVQISQFNLPGTHDTGCLYVDLGFDDTAKTQDLTVAEQLDAGIRVLDIRCGDLSGFFTDTQEWWKLGVCHNFIDCYKTSARKEFLTLGDVMKDIDIFLEKHPTETVILEAVQEGFLDSTKDDAVEALQYMAEDLHHNRIKYIDYNPANDNWSRFLFYAYGDTVPLLSDCRGKCVVISSPRVNGVNGRSYTNYEKEYDQDYRQRQDCLQFIMQDYFNPYLQDYSKRTDCFIENNMRNVLKPGNPDVMLYGYNTNTMERLEELDLGGAHGPKYHYDNMKDTLESFCPSVGRRIGWIGMDFPTETMIQSIIKSNKTADAILRLRLQPDVSSIELFKHVQLLSSGFIYRNLPNIEWTKDADGTYMADITMRFCKDTLLSGDFQMRFPNCASCSFSHILHYIGETDGIYEYELYAASETPYREYSDEINYFDTKICQEFTTISKDTINWTNGWYVQNQSNITITDPITVDGDVYLILKNDTTVNLIGGINITDGSSLTIFAQTEGSRKGKFNVSCDNSVAINNGSMVISGGNISLTGGKGFAAINGKLIINGGSVSAKAGSGIANAIDCPVVIDDRYALIDSTTGNPIKLSGATQSWKDALSKSTVSFNTVVKVIYLEYSEDGKNCQKKEIIDYKFIDGSFNTLNAGYYLAAGTLESDSALTVNGDIKLILANRSKLTLNGGICVNEGNSLTVFAQSEGDEAGELIAKGKDRCAGIGGRMGYTSGNITIHGGNITASGGNSANGIGGGAGIGGGNDGDSSPVVIYGGNITAMGGEFAAGIGGGYGGWCGDVTIYGGMIKAVGGDNDVGYGGAGIGGGATNSNNWYSGGCDYITVFGGEVEAIGGFGSAGIGGGYAGSTFAEFTIYGGVVEATGGDFAVGLGNGAECKDSDEGAVNIYGGTLIMRGGRGTSRVIGYSEGATQDGYVNVENGIELINIITGTPITRSSGQSWLQALNAATDNQSGNSVLPVSVLSKMNASTPIDTDKSTEKEPVSPSPGDTSNLTLWVILIVFSSMGLSACLVLGKKRKNGQ